jgi:predicted nuclease of predicted toxin-antitoxin system
VTEPALFIRLYLDEDVSVFLAQLLRPHGFEVPTTREAKNLGCSDTAQLQFATARQPAILTHNRCDFEQLHEAALRDQQPHTGILIASRRASDFELARRIMTVLDTFTAEEVTNQLFYV